MMSSTQEEENKDKDASPVGGVPRHPVPVKAPQISTSTVEERVSTKLLFVEYGVNYQKNPNWESRK
jgi:hypothetical protein